MTYFIKTSILGVCTAATLSGCAGAYKLEPPPGFALVSEGDYETRMKAQDNVGLSVRRFENVKGGTLAYWASDLVNKLGKRGYVLTGQTAVDSSNGREGTRFEFDYTLPGGDTPKFYTVSLFVTDKYKVVVQVAGDKQFAAVPSTEFRARVAGLDDAGKSKLRTEMKAHFESTFAAATGDFPSRVDAAVRAVSREYGLGYYAGTDGLLTRQ